VSTRRQQMTNNASFQRLYPSTVYVISLANAYIDLIHDINDSSIFYAFVGIWKHQ